jgi:hypothetical protein
MSVLMISYDSKIDWLQRAQASHPPKEFSECCAGSSADVCLLTVL